MSDYKAEDIEVLTGLDPVRKRPGMYTDTARPNHLAQEVIDNSVDEALAGHAKKSALPCTTTAASALPTTGAACLWIFTPSRVCPASR